MLIILISTMFQLIHQTMGQLQHIYLWVTNFLQTMTKPYYKFDGKDICLVELLNHCNERREVFDQILPTLEAKGITELGISQMPLNYDDLRSTYETRSNDLVQLADSLNVSVPENATYEQKDAAKKVAEIKKALKKAVKLFEASIHIEDKEIGIQEVLVAPYFTLNDVPTCIGHFFGLLSAIPL